MNTSAANLGLNAPAAVYHQPNGIQVTCQVMPSPTPNSTNVPVTQQQVVYKQNPPHISYQPNPKMHQEVQQDAQGFRIVRPSLNVRPAGNPGRPEGAR